MEERDAALGWGGEGLGEEPQWTLPTSPVVTPPHLVISMEALV